jgi:transcriptional regulator with XRE-family HTH domain
MSMNARFAFQNRINSCITATMDHLERVVCQFIRALRGKRSQVAFSRRLGFLSNTAADWESGRRVPNTTVVLDACKRCGVDVEEAFRGFHPRSAPALGEGDDAGVAAWLNELRGSTSVSMLAERVHRSRSAVSRWLSGRCRPRLTDFFALIEAITGRLSDLVANIVDIESVPELLSAHRARQSAKRLAFEEPWTEAILRVLETTEYRQLQTHVPGWIGSRLQIDLETEERCLQALLSAGVIEEGAQGYVFSSMTVDTVATPEEMNLLKAHWTQVALQRLQSPKPDDIFSYNLMSLSAPALEQVRDVLRGAYREIRSIAAAEQDEEVVAQVNLQLFTF